MNKTYLYILFCLVLFSSCASSSYYQLYEVKPTQKSLSIDDDLIYEDANCKIFYNFWSNGGDAGFDFYNKTDEDIYLLLDKSNFILNGVAYDYFKNREFSESKKKSLAVSKSGYYKKGEAIGGIGEGFQYGNSVKIIEDSIIRIPAGTQKSISEYLINNSLVRNCDLPRYPRTKKDVRNSNFDELTTPFVFGNLVRYRHNGNLYSVKNNFYVSKITNYNYNDFTYQKYDEFCGLKKRYPTSYFRYSKPTNFYIKYSIEQTTSYHGNYKPYDNHKN